MTWSNLPMRTAVGAFLVHTGMDKVRGDAEVASRIRAMAATAFPVVERIPEPTFLRIVAYSELAVAGALLTPVVPRVVAGAALTGLSASFLGLYLRTPGLRRPGSVRPTAQGQGISKDVWMLGIGLTLLAQELER